MVRPQEDAGPGKRIINRRSAIALLVAIVGLGAIGGGTPSAQTGSVTKTFSFIAGPNSGGGKVIVNIDGLTINARCNARGEPVIYAFSNTDADLFGRVFDGYGRLSSIKQSSSVKGNPGVLLWVNAGDFDASGNVLYETYRGAVVTVNYAFDNATTLAKRNCARCTARMSRAETVPGCLVLHARCGGPEPGDRPAANAQRTRRNASV